MLAGAATFAAIADWAVDLDAGARRRLGFAGPLPVGTTVGVPGPARRPGPAGGADRLAALPPRPSAAGAAARRRVVIRVDGKVLRGTLLSIGDGHGAQGNGEVGGTAIECGMTTTMTLDLVPTQQCPPSTRSPASRVTFGFHADLNEAMADALDAMVGWMQTLYGVDKPSALALASTSVDLRITQVANQTRGVDAPLSHNPPRRRPLKRAVHHPNLPAPEHVARVPGEPVTALVRDQMSVGDDRPEPYQLHGQHPSGTSAAAAGTLAPSTQSAPAPWQSPSALRPTRAGPPDTTDIPWPTH
jgi:hypothetical protein